MARPKGSANKKSKKKEETTELHNSRVENIPHPTKEEKKTSKKGNCSECSHAEDKHYGNESRWCNIQYCQCQAFK